jgi:hypothetical protein
MNKNLTINMGNCNHRKYAPKLVEMARNGTIDPAAVLTQIEPITDAIEAYRAFDRPGNRMGEGRIAAPNQISSRIKGPKDQSCWRTLHSR